MPLLHKIVPPEQLAADRLIDVPAQTVWLGVLTYICVGEGDTIVIVPVPLLVHVPDVQVTVYVVVTVGATVIVPPVTPVFHVRTPLQLVAVSTTEVPGQTGEAGTPLTEIGAGVLTVIVTAELAELAGQVPRVQVAV
jgi:hypothetical protein